MRRRGRAGLTLIELIVAFTIMLLLSTMALPLARSKVRREKEKELRFVLREMKVAIDKYKDLSDQNLIPVDIGTEGYPKTIEILVEGVKLQGPADRKIRFLRKIPKDPMTGKTEWGLRSVQDDPKSSGWGGQNVFDVYSKSMDKAADGTPYSEW